MGTFGIISIRFSPSNTQCAQCTTSTSSQLPCATLLILTLTTTDSGKIRDVRHSTCRNAPQHAERLPNMPKGSLHIRLTFRTDTLTTDSFESLCASFSTRASLHTLSVPCVQMRDLAIVRANPCQCAETTNSRTCKQCVIYSEFDINIDGLERTRTTTTRRRSGETILQPSSVVGLFAICSGPTDVKSLTGCKPRTNYVCCHCSQ